MNAKLSKVIGGIGLALVLGSTWAQDYPTRPIRIIVPAVPGGGQDIIARSIAPDMTKVLGQPVLVENRPGGGNMVAFEYVAKQQPADGHTLAISTSPVLATSPLTIKDLRYDPLTDIPPFIGLGETRFTVVTSAQRPWKSLNELIAYAKANPQKVNMGYNAVLTMFLASTISRDLGENVFRVQYKGTSDILRAVFADEAHLCIIGESDTPASDKVRVLGITGEGRSSRFPNVPTLTEMGFPRIPNVTYFLNTARGTPKLIVDKLHAAAATAQKNPETRAAWQKFALEPLNMGPEAAQKLLADEAKIYADVAKRLGVEPK